jgi:hypothetical protein
MVDRNERRGDDDDGRKNEYRRRDRDPEYITLEQAKELIQKSNVEELVKAFRSLGIDIMNYEDVKKFYNDFDYLRKSREMNIERKSTFSKSIITTVVGAVLGVITSFLAYFVNHAK